MIRFSLVCKLTNSFHDLLKHVSSLLCGDKSPMCVFVSSLNVRYYLLVPKTIF